MLPPSPKFHPFSPEVPTSTLWSAPSIESFCWRIEQQIGEGGFALAIGDPGTGKSAALRILALDLAVSVASGTPCLRRFAAQSTGPVILFPAEDSWLWCVSAWKGFARQLVSLRKLCAMRTTTVCS